jgi:hypothetical protein
MEQTEEPIIRMKKLCKQKKLQQMRIGYLFFANAA